MTRTGAVARPPIEDRTESFFEWTQTHVREIVIAAIAIAVAFAGAALYRSSKASQADQADRALYGAEQSYASGNLPLAASDLQKVTTRFGNTTSGVQAAMLLAQVQFEQKKYAEGIAALEKIEGAGAAKPFRASIHALMAAGFEDQGKYRDAAKHFEAAAGATEYANEKQVYAAHAARSYQAAGDRATAIAKWTELAKDPTSSVAGEARIRLGELAVAPGR